IKLAAKPILNVVGITTESGNSICEIEKELRKKNWMLGNFADFNLIRIVIMPHITKSHISKFLDDLQLIIKQLKI
ncbi:MAG TPA: tyrosine decarboxylase MfnA, partial [Candidatus Lokiarchaeia archaeon]